MTAPKRVTARPTTTNVLRTFWLATPEEFEEGREWYRRANDLAVELAQKTFGGSPRCVEDNDQWDEELAKAVGVIAVLSPQESWDRNVEKARRIYDEWNATRTGRPIGDYRMLDSWPGLKASAVKALRILDGEKPEDVVSGPKVTAFYRAILDPHDPRGIVIDRHAFDVAVGRVMDDRTRGIVLGRAGAYESFVRAYERAAAKLSTELTHSGWNAYGTHPVKNVQPWTPAEVQAVTWVAWRRLKKEGKV